MYTARIAARSGIFTLNSHTAHVVPEGPLNTLLRVSAPIAEGSRMKRIAAIVTLAFVVLAIPATAMASTSGSGTGGGNNRYAQVNSGGLIRVICPLPREIRVRPGQVVKVTFAGGQAQSGYLKAGGKRVRFFCPVPWRFPGPPVLFCGRHGNLRRVVAKRHVYRIFRTATVCRK
jgi:hypothetical protein